MMGLFPKDRLNPKYRAPIEKAITTIFNAFYIPAYATTISITRIVLYIAVFIASSIIILLVVGRFLANSSPKLQKLVYIFLTLFINILYLPIIGTFNFRMLYYFVASMR
jgi:hypothetical protein